MKLREFDETREALDRLVSWTCGQLFNATERYPAASRLKALKILEVGSREVAKSTIRITAEPIQGQRTETKSGEDEVD